MDEKQSEHAPARADRQTIERVHECLRIIERIRALAPELLIDVVSDSAIEENPPQDANEEDETYPNAA